MLPVHPSSASYISAIGGASTKLRAKVSTLAWSPPNGWGIPYNLVNNATPTYSPTFTFSSQSDAGPYPIPASPLIEEPSAIGSDRHYVAFNTDTGFLYEIESLGGSAPNWTGASGAVFNLASNNMRPDTWTSADAAGLPILPGLLLYDEIASGAITHALRVCLPFGSGTYIWPARHADGSTAGTPPHGTRFRLRASFDISSYSTVNQIILQALKIYGCFFCDQSGGVSEFRLFGMSESRWNNTDLQVLNDTITANNFEVVDESSLLISSNSMQSANPAGFSAFAMHV